MSAIITANAVVSLVRPLLAAMVLAVAAQAVAAQASVSPGNLEQCAEWRKAHGAEKATLANQLGTTNLLTKNQRLAEAHPGTSRSLYRTSDLQRLCRTP